MQIVNWSRHDQRLSISLPGLDQHVEMNITTLAGEYRLETNTLEEPHKVGWRLLGAAMPRWTASQARAALQVQPFTELNVPLERLQRLSVPATSFTVLELHIHHRPGEQPVQH